ncbi:hypothetical protein IGI04_017444 [Brassica rapa subsp. trilocularis]|uniref:Transmembrane protein n=1 Tax=Brassica rapa subsp. trilocularis TaxID=1813537 RepID=A0ABQ7MB76_BRACM|nr:hypothetical protein IGI04_017444 [Brassica rapa subsp. trilocularis]
MTSLGPTIREARSTFESGARPARERPCRRRSLFLFVVVVPLHFLFAVLSTSALSDLCHRPHPFRWFGYGVTTRSSGGPRWRKWLACTVVVFSGRWRLLQIHRRRFELPGRESSSDSSSPLSAMESGGYQRSALPFGIPMFFGKKVYEVSFGSWSVWLSSWWVWVTADEISVEDDALRRGDGGQEKKRDGCDDSGEKNGLRSLEACRVLSSDERGSLSVFVPVASRWRRLSRDGDDALSAKGADLPACRASLLDALSMWGE